MYHWLVKIPARLREKVLVFINGGIECRAYIFSHCLEGRIKEDVGRQSGMTPGAQMFAIVCRKENVKKIEKVGR